MAVTAKVIRGLKRLRLTLADLATDLTGSTNAVSTKFNAFRTYLGDGVLQIGTVVIDAVPEKFKTTTTALFRITGVGYSKAAATAIVFSGASTINNAQASGTGHWGAFLVQINAAGVVTTKHAAYTSGTDQDYATQALAAAALPAPDAGNVALASIRVQVKTGGTKWTEATDDLTPASDCTTAVFVDATPLAMPAAL